MRLVFINKSATDGKEHAKIKTKQQKQKCGNISLIFLWASLVARMVKNLIAMQETWVEMVTFRTLTYFVSPFLNVTTRTSQIPQVVHITVLLGSTNPEATARGPMGGNQGGRQHS